MQHEMYKVIYKIITQKAEKYLKFGKSLRRDFARFDPSYHMVSLTLLQ